MPRVGIVGYGIEGKASAHYWADLGYEVTVCDEDEKLAIPEGLQSQLGSGYLENLEQFDVIVRSAGVHPHLLLEQNDDIENKITTSINEFIGKVPSANLFGITGTKGKGTTATLAAKMLEAAGRTVHLGGNIGVAALELLPKIQPDDFIILELSSFQLIDFHGRIPTAACLMVVPEHLNWHADTDEYVKAKSQLFSGQTSEDRAIYNADYDLSKQAASTSSGKQIPFSTRTDEVAPGAACIKDDHVYIDGEEIIAISEVALPGRHNLENICAAITLVWSNLGGNLEAIRSVLKTFRGLEHRLEFVRELDGVIYINDSFSTMPEATITALQSFAQPKTIIIGGSDKGADVAPMIDEIVKDNVKHVITMGDLADKLTEMLKEQGFDSVTSKVNSMEEVVRVAKEHAASGDVVLLSSGCASFGLFENSRDRGSQFKAAVNKL